MNNLEGLQFGKFRMERLLGIGGFSVAYKAFDLEKASNVTIKLLLIRWLTNRRVVRSFQYEGQTLSQLDHPNLIKVYEVGELYGQPYQVMSWHEGRTFDQFLRESRDEIDGERLSRILDQVALGLDYIHQSRMVHRDLKPSNTLILNNDAVKLLDFGLSLDLLGEGLRERQPAGTVRYMAPEQRLGGRLTPQSDIYSFGMMVKESFDTVEIPLPFEGSTMIENALEKNFRDRPRDASSIMDVICRHFGVIRP